MTLIISKGLTLDNGTRAAAIAGVSPTLDYRFAREKREIETVSLTDKLTYTGGNGTFVGSDGFIQRATTNVPRFDHDPLSRQSLGLLGEVERTNLLTISEDWTGSVMFRGTVTANASAAPDGKTTAESFRETTETGNHIIQAPSSIAFTSGTAYTYSVFIKPIGRTNIRINANQPTTFPADALFDLTDNGSFVAVLGTASVQRFPNGWYRCSISAAATATLFTAFSHRTSSSTGDTSLGIDVWGCMLEAASTPSTYIPTTTAAVTRTADSAVIDGTGVITGTYTMVEKPAGCAVVSGTNINLQPGFTAERVMVFPAALDAGQITAIRGAM